MGKLHELLAVEADLQNEYKKATDSAKAVFAKNPGHFMGFTRRLEMFADSSKDAPIENQEVTETITNRLHEIGIHAERFFDAVLQKEATNSTAKADLYVDSVLIGQQIPATFLLGLETKLKHLLGVFEDIPTLPPGFSFVKDEEKGLNIWKIVDAEKKFKTQKTFKHKVLYQATKEHPAQIERWEEVENVGVYVAERWFGMFSQAQKTTLIGNLNKLLSAVKVARQKANCEEVTTQYIGQSIFSYLLQGLD